MSSGCGVEDLGVGTLEWHMVQGGDEDGLILVIVALLGAISGGVVMLENCM